MSSIPQGDTWQITTKTFSGTCGSSGGDVTLKITGSRGTSRELIITDYLTAGRTQTFTFTNVEDVGEVESLYVDIAGTDGWSLDTITLKNTGTRSPGEYKFTYFDSLDTDSVPAVKLYPGMCQNYHYVYVQDVQRRWRIAMFEIDLREY